MDGKADKLYCQNLCLLSKLFLDHKTVYYDIDMFWFYVLTERSLDESGNTIDKIVGYFSKDKDIDQEFNLACILTLPPYQKKGYGKLLIEFSYMVSKLEKRIGSPERPLSDLGLTGYRSYWISVILGTLLKTHTTHPMTVRELSLLTCIRQEDIVSTLSFMDMIRFWKGDHLICVTAELMKAYIEKHKVKLDRVVDVAYLVDSPQGAITNT